MTEGAAGGIRASARRIVDRAAEAGVPSPWRLTELTPAELESELRARAARRQRDEAQLDLLAFLIGRYAALGVHAPARYPQAPDMLRRAPREMSDAEMKRRLLDMAGRRNRTHGGD